MKSQIEDKEGIPRDKQRLVSSGTVPTKWDVKSTSLIVE